MKAMLTLVVLSLLLVLSLLATPPPWLQTLSHGVDTTSGARHVPTQTLTRESRE